jgi:hypothetical protein
MSSSWNCCRIYTGSEKWSSRRKDKSPSTPSSLHFFLLLLPQQHMLMILPNSSQLIRKLLRVVTGLLLPLLLLPHQTPGHLLDLLLPECIVREIPCVCCGLASREDRFYYPCFPPGPKLGWHCCHHHRCPSTTAKIAACLVTISRSKNKPARFAPLLLPLVQYHQFLPYHRL